MLRMVEATDGGAISIHCFELEVAPLGEGGDKVEENPRIKCRFWFQISEDHKWFRAVVVHG